mmetsp:Transcript_15131/g.32096  ORF Transcript_15131/g.32096 Transcript_15131/m.32096 type:complete len:85 (+) Transcript_15131:230-484(+)
MSHVPISNKNEHFPKIPAWNRWIGNLCYDTYDLVSHHLERYSISTPGRMNAVILPSLTSIYQEDLICRKHYFVQRHEDEAGFLR